MQSTASLEQAILDHLRQLPPERQQEVLDFDDQGKLIGIDIDHASQTVDLSRLETQSLPLTNLALTSQVRRI